MDDNTTLTELIKENKGLICSIIKKYSSYYEFDDLYQVSIIGIIKANKNYRKEMNVKFSSYAYKYILSEILLFINNSKLIKQTSTTRRLYKKVNDARNILTQKLMKEPTNHELSIFLEIDEKIINDITRYQECIKSLDEYSLDYDENIKLLDKISIDKNNINIENLSLKEELNKLSEEDYKLINMRYFEDKTQSETAQVLGINQVKVSRTEQKVLKKLKNNLCQT